MRFSGEPGLFPGHHAIIKSEYYKYRPEGLMALDFLGKILNKRGNILFHPKYPW
jgi:hypothetical protein